MPFTQSITHARRETIGTHGVTAAALEAELIHLEPALERLRARHADGSLALLRLPAETGDLDEINAHAARIRAGATDVVLLGTGGSSLGAQTLCQLADHGVAGVGAFRAGPRLHFMDNLDPITFQCLLERLPLATTHFVAVSKSGGTGETLMQVCATIAVLKAAGMEGRIAQLFTGLSEPTRPGKVNGLRRLLESFGVPMLEHHTGVGGRYSVLTNVGLLPAAIAGLDPAKVRAGAATALAPVLAGAKPADVPAALGAALSIALGKPTTVLMPYADRLGLYGRWWVQLWAESLGKEGKGTTPIAATGPVDQHSQLQLFIAGPRDKLFTILTTDIAGKGPKIDKALAELGGEPGFADKTIGDLVAAQGRATADTLARNGCPVRTFHVPTLNEVSLGALLMHMMLETILAADLLAVDPYDQPAVEEGKTLAKQYLQG